VLRHEIESPFAPAVSVPGSTWPSVSSSRPFGAGGFLDRQAAPPRLLERQFRWRGHVRRVEPAQRGQQRQHLRPRQHERPPGCIDHAHALAVDGRELHVLLDQLAIDQHALRGLGRRRGLGGLIRQHGGQQRDGEQRVHFWKIGR
jgi:hypothetical protein